MFMTVVLLVVSLGLAAFMANRLYVMAVNNAIDVKGQHYEQASDPFLFWFFALAACFGLVFGASLFIAAMAMLITGV